MNKSHFYTFLCAASFAGTVVHAQEFPSIINPQFANTKKLASEDKNILNHLDLGVTAGTTGIGIDLAMPVTKWAQIRVGATYMPHFHLDAHYNAEVGDYAGTKEEMDSKFEKLSGLLENFTGIVVDDRVNMIKEPTFHNAKAIVDVFPLRDKRWHVSAGVFYGKSQVAKTYNTTEDMNTLMAISLYNNMYYKAIAEEPLITYNGTSVFLPPQFTDKFREYGLISIPIGYFAKDIVAQEDVYWDHTEVDGLTLEYVVDPVSGTEIIEGNLRCAQGDVLYRKGDPYKMTPDKADNMVKASVEVDKFKPYIGFGYSGPVFKNSDRTNISFDCGVMFWGGTPKAYTHDGVDMVHDLNRLRKKVQKDVDLIKLGKVFPLLEVRLSHRLF